MRRLTLYSKPGCHLCDEMKLIVDRVAGDFPGTSVTEVDISNDAALLARYELEIPVLLVDDRKVGKYRISESDLRRMLNR